MKPYKVVKPKTLARWMTEVIKEGGVDTSQWQQHAARAASAAYHREVRGLSSRQICNLADWSSVSSTYQKFYKRYT